VSIFVPVHPFLLELIMINSLRVSLHPQAKSETYSDLSIQQQLYTALQVSPALCIVDMAHVESINCQDLAVLAKAFQSACEKQCRLVFCNVQPLVKIVFEISQLDRRLEIIDDSASAEQMQVLVSL
jgi:anti-sigma B factor antagonist